MESIVKKLGRINAEMLLQAAKVASVVGTVLLLINQWPALFEGQPLRVLPAVLTYCVPFCVFLYGKLSAED